MSSVFIITNTAGTETLTLAPGQVNGPISGNSASDLRLYGMGAYKWGEGFDENFYRLLENFAAPQKQAGDYNPVTSNNDYDPNTQDILPKDINDLGPGKGITYPITGQFWFNTDTGTIYTFDSSIGTTFGWKRVSGGVPSSSTSPSSPQIGDLWYDTNTQQMNTWNGSQWISVADQYLPLDGSGTMSGTLDLGSNTISNVTDPVNPQDAATKQYVDTEVTNIVSGGALDGTYVNLSGDTMTGILELDVPSGSRLDLSYSSSTLTLGNGGNITSGSDIRKNSNMLSSADGNMYFHFSSGNSFRVAQGSDNRGSGYTDFLTVNNSGIVSVRSNYESLGLTNNSLTNKGYVDNEISSNTVHVSGGQFTGNVGILRSPGVELDVDGEIRATGEITAFASDERLKENIMLLQQCVDKVEQIDSVEFDWTDQAYSLGIKPHQKHQTGVLAQQVQQVLPDAVRPAPFNEDYLTVQYEKLTTLLIGAVNELNQTIKSQEERIQALENNN